MGVNLRESWWIGDVEVPTRVVLAPMAGVSVQAFRRQGRRYGAGLVCSEMVSCAGIEHGTSARSATCASPSDEHPLAIQIFGSDPAAMAEAARMVESAGADLVDMNFGCPVRKVTKTGAGAHLLQDADLACRITEAVASAVSVPVSVKMRRGVEDGSRACLEVGPRLVEAGAATLTLHPRSAKQMYTGYADHSLTAELVELVDVPVIASGDVTSHAKAQAVLDATGAAAVMVGRGAQGNPWAIREIVFGDAEQPSREEVAAELIVFIRETVRELGERRASGFLKKFYGWYLGHGRFPRPFKQEIVMLHSTEEVVTRLLAAAPDAAELVERLEAELPDPDDDVLLDRLPISVYGGGSTPRQTLVAVAVPDDPQAVEREERVDRGDRARVRRDQVGEAAGRDRRRVGPELAADRVDDPVHLAGEAVDEPRLQRRRGRLADHLRRLDVVDLHESRARSCEQRVHRDLHARCEHAADVVAAPARRRRSSSTSRSRRRSPARRSAPSPRPRSRSGRGRPRAGRRSGSGCPS